MGIGSLSFVTPWLLGALALLPIIWWILRVTPPAPKRVIFPAIAFLFGAEKHDETPAHTPLWLLILRLAVAGLVIIGLAGPVFNAKKTVLGAGPLLIAIDDGWPSAANWTAIKSAAIDLADEAARAGKPVIVLRTAPGPAQSFAPVAPVRAKSLLQALQPQPWRPDRKAALAAFKAVKQPRAARQRLLALGRHRRPRRADFCERPFNDHQTRCHCSRCGASAAGPSPRQIDIRRAGVRACACHERAPPNGNGFRLWHGRQADGPRTLRLRTGCGSRDGFARGAHGSAQPDHADPDRRRHERRRGDASRRPLAASCGRSRLRRSARKRTAASVGPLLRRARACSRLRTCARAKLATSSTATRR